MGAANTMIGEGVGYVGTYDEPNYNATSPVAIGGGSDDAIPNYVALFVLLAVLALVAIRLGGLQGMIAVGR